MKHAPEFLKLVADAKTRIRETNVQEVKQKLDAEDPITIIDVREDNEWAKGHLPGPFIWAGVSSSATSSMPCLERQPRSCSTAGAGSAPL